MRITARHRRAIAALIAGRSRPDAAAAAGVTTRTLRNWMADDDFRDELGREMDAVVSTAGRMFLASVEEAVLKIKQIMNDPEASDNVKLRAALAIVDHTADFVAIEALNERLASLEAYFAIGENN